MNQLVFFLALCFVQKKLHFLFFISCFRCCSSSNSYQLFYQLNKKLLFAIGLRPWLWYSTIEIFLFTLTAIVCFFDSCSSLYRQSSLTYCSNDETEGGGSYSQCCLVTSCPASHLLGCWYGSSTARCHVQVRPLYYMQYTSITSHALTCKINVTH